jgi:transposase
MGRPTKLTPEVQERLCEAIAAGNYYEPACAYAGVAYSTFMHWKTQGETAKSGPYRQFLEAVKEAEAKAEMRMVEQWRSQMPEDWRAARDFLARRFPGRWGPKEQGDHGQGRWPGAVARELDDRGSGAG